MIPGESPDDPRLQAIWKRIPEMKDCKGLCHTSCGPVPVTGVEKESMEKRGKKMAITDGDNGPMTCSLLTPDGRCSVYDGRPLMCRVWGAVKSLPCPYGCEPESWLSDYEVFQMIQEATAISGEADDAAMTNMLEILGPTLARVWEEEVGRSAKAAAEHVKRGGTIEWREQT